MIPIAPIADTNNIRMADFVRVTTNGTVYLFSTAPSALTIPAVDANPFTALGALMKIGDTARDIKSTANETTVTIVGLDTTYLGWVLGQDIKGSQIEMWHGFFDTNGALINNQLLYSEQFGNAAWSQTAVTIVANSTTAPNGTLTADKIIKSASTSFHFVAQSAPTGTVTISCYMKAAELTTGTLFLTQSGNNGGTYDLSAGTFTIIGTGNTGTMTSVGNGWYLCTLTQTANSAAGMRVGAGNGALASSLGDGTSGIYIWGAQLTTFAQPSQYAPTTSSINSGLYQFFNGYISSFSISEQWSEEARSYLGVISIAASAIQLILQNRTAGRFTNDNAWTFYNPTDSSMNRVAFISTINYLFGKT